MKRYTINRHCVVNKVVPMRRNSKGFYNLYVAVFCTAGIQSNLSFGHTSKRIARHAQHMLCSTGNKFRLAMVSNAKSFAASFSKEGRK